MSIPNDAQHPSPLVNAPEATRALLARLHAESLAQESVFDLRAVPADEFRGAVADKFIALDEDKCQFVYQLLRATGARRIVEAGTSYGVSTIYLALAAAENAAALGGDAVVIGTEHEEAKADKARAYWAESGTDAVKTIDLRVGDLRETLKTGLGEIDFLLLDIWTPMALPTLKLVQPHFRPGAVIVADNPITSAKGYAELWEYIRAPGSGFTSLNVPYSNGLEMVVYYPPK
ncbi:hypothetical protein VHUM_00690 [Vanrija humicola]|uniref:O-methyltransferase n=1 Tax=Vanrija humicola TaxID=5417 RepID=A0A7D8V249_VANHU|nr:hypothetical protein VHUM_00690 [Vanrija humicola]